jgi:hypothetical protein
MRTYTLIELKVLHDSTRNVSANGRPEPWTNRVHLTFIVEPSVQYFLIASIVHLYPELPRYPDEGLDDVVLFGSRLSFY